MASISNLILNHFHKNSEEKGKKTHNTKENSIYVTVAEKIYIGNAQLWEKNI